MSELPPPDPHAGETSRSGSDDGGRRRRQRLVGLAGLAIGVVLAVVLLVTVGGGDDGGDAGAEVERWNAVVAASADSGELTVYDRDGDELDTIDTGFETTRSVVTRGRFALVHDGESDAAAVVDTASGEVTWSRKPSTDRGEIMWLQTTTEPIVVEAAYEGENAVLVDATTGEEIDVAASADLDEPGIIPTAIFPIDDDVYAAASVRGDPQTAIVGFGDVEPTVVDGMIVGSHDGDLIVSTTDVDISKLSFGSVDDLDGLDEPDDAPGIEGLRAVKLTGEREAVTLTQDGRLLRVEPGDDDPAEIASVELGGRDVLYTFTPPGVDRIVIGLHGDDDTDDESGDATSANEAGDDATDDTTPPDSEAPSNADDEVVVIDLSGAEIARFRGSPRILAFIDPIRCAWVDDDERVSVVDLVTGDELASIDEEGNIRPVGSADGCTMVLDQPNGPDRKSVILSRSGTHTIDGSVGVVSADGSAVAVRTGEKTIDIVDVDDPDGDAVQLDGVTAAGFVTR